MGNVEVAKKEENTLDMDVTEEILCGLLEARCFATTC